MEVQVSFTGFDNLKWIYYTFVGHTLGPSNLTSGCYGARIQEMVVRYKVQVRMTRIRVSNGLIPLQSITQCNPSSLATCMCKIPQYPVCKGDPDLILLGAQVWMQAASTAQFAPKYNIFMCNTRLIAGITLIHLHYPQPPSNTCCVPATEYKWLCLNLK